MGQGPSVEDGGGGGNDQKKDKIHRRHQQQHAKDPSIVKLNDEIERVREELYLMKQMGKEIRCNQEEEIYELEMKVYKRKFLLHRRGEDAKKYMSFWEYVQIVNASAIQRQQKKARGEHKSVDTLTLSEHKARLQAEEAESKMKKKKKTTTTTQGTSTKTTKTTTTTSTALVHQSNVLSFNIFSFFEAFLLRRLHIAMILKHQRAAQSEAWNSVIIFLFHQTPNWKQRLKHIQETYYDALKPESMATIKAMRKARKKKLAILQRMVQTLKEEVSTSSSEEEEEEDMEQEEVDDCDLLSSDDHGGLIISEDMTTTSGEMDLNDDDNNNSDNDGDKVAIKAAAAKERSLDAGGSSHSFRSSASKHGNSRHGRMMKRRSSNASEASSSVPTTPNWMKSSRNKVSRSIHREQSLHTTTTTTTTSNNNKNKNNGFGMNDYSTRSGGGNVTDDEIEAFLYPNRPTITKRRSSTKRRGRKGSITMKQSQTPQQKKQEHNRSKSDGIIMEGTSNTRPNNNNTSSKPTGLPSELVLSSASTVVSHLPDDASSLDSGSHRTFASILSERSKTRPSSLNRMNSISDIKRRKRELEELRSAISNSAHNPRRRLSSTSGGDDDQFQQ
eukprot:scaffold4663_cov109-Cylindrotheca_fusiformis.AAC.14